MVDVTELLNFRLGRFLPFRSSMTPTTVVYVGLDVSLSMAFTALRVSRKFHAFTAADEGMTGGAVIVELESFSDSALWANVQSMVEPCS